MKPFKLPESLLLGAGTSAFQIEGNDPNNSWYRWSKEPGRITDGTDCSVACDHWNRYVEDVKLMKTLNLGTYRFGLEWSRIEPEKGKFSNEALDQYRDEIMRIKKAGMIPLVTLHHFSNPLWLEDSCSWIKKDVIAHFDSYVSRVIESLGDLVSDWITINEPNVYMVSSYVFGDFPPGKHSTRLYFKGARYMIGAHIKAYQTIHRIRREMGFEDTRVGVAHHLRLFDPMTGSAAERFTARKFDRYFHDIFLSGMSSGRLLFPSGFGYPYGRGDFQDFIGINYYSRDMVRFSPGNIDKMISVRDGADINDLGWEIYPGGLYRVCAGAYEKSKKPIFITENGTCDNNDTFRPRFIYDHLEQVKRLIDDGIDIARYYHWSFMDNFELDRGLSYRFGLYHVNFETQKRTLKKSGKLYRDICQNHAITAKMIQTYLTRGG